jgi:hypothetical protein
MNFILKVLQRISPNRLRLSDVLALYQEGNCFFEELKSSLTHTQIEIVETKNDRFFAKFIEKESEYLLCFASDGKFLYIEHEYWKDLNVRFTSRNRKEVE